ncbi:hypothetical protein E3A20_18570, partial [Planctomyces bekefii]
TLSLSLLKEASGNLHEIQFEAAWARD